MNYIGMDIHKQFTVAVAKDKEGNLLSEDKFENSKENFRAYLSKFPIETTKILMESTCVWEYIFELIEEFGYSAKLSNPVKTKAIAYARIKTDYVDADTLCDLLRANLVAESYIPQKHIRQLREITRERKTFVKQTTQLKNKIHAVLIKRGIKLPYATLCKSALDWLLDRVEIDDVLKHYINLLEYHEQELGFIEDKIKNISYETNNAKLLMTIPGIGSIRAVEIIAEIGEIGRFESAGKLCSYAGLVPSIKQSGNTLRFGKLIKQSNKSLKYVFVETSWNLIRVKENNRFRKFYLKLSKKKGKQKAICAVARKLCCVVYAMLAKNQEFMLL